MSSLGRPAAAQILLFCACSATGGALGQDTKAAGLAALYHQFRPGRDRVHVGVSGLCWAADWLGAVTARGPCRSLLCQMAPRGGN